jgi:lipopolysaccharide transport system ATP-binding protein
MVRVEGLWRKFGLSVGDGLRYGLIDSTRRLVGRGKDSENLRRGEFWALQDVNFELRAGDALGIMGVNGSGKTTLLRILNGTYSPDRGQVSMKGAVGSLIAAGAGFSPMLTGRENVYVNATLLGMSSEEIARQFDEIVEFADLGKFIDMPVRNYSSGMSVRLGFAIAIMSVPEILLVDEVLAVGDLTFQKRCYEKMLDVRNNGATLLFVSHSVGSVWAVCNCGLFLNRGISSGRIGVEELGRLYDLENARASAVRASRSALLNSNGLSQNQRLAAMSRDSGGREGGSGDVYLQSFVTCNTETWSEASEFEFGEAIGLELEVVVLNPVPKAVFRYTFDAMHYKFICDADSSFADGMGLRDLSPGVYRVRTVIQNPRFRAGAYSINLAVCQKNVGVHLYYLTQAATIVVRPRRDKFDYDSSSLAVVQFDARFDISTVSSADGTAVMNSVSIAAPER